MSSKNYKVQGGDEWVIGGTISDFSKISNQAAGLMKNHAS